MPTCEGRIAFRHPCAPKAGGTVQTMGRLGREDGKGKARAAPEARRVVAVASAQPDSFQEAQASDTQPRGRMALRVRLLRRRTRADREHAQTSELQLETLQPTSHCLPTPNPA